MWYKVNFNVFSIQLLPTFLRKPALMAFVQILLKPISELYSDWSIIREKNMYKLYHTGQVCYLRKSLNDTFDLVKRRITITEGELYDISYIYTEGFGEKKYIYTENLAEVDSKPIWLRTEAETADTGVDFRVILPKDINESELESINAHINFYKAGGKRYK